MLENSEDCIQNTDVVPHTRRFEGHSSSKTIEILKSVKSYCRAMMKKVELNHFLLEELPRPIIWEILSRLPTKACLTCKLVCKDWYQIIIDPVFMKLRSSNLLYSTIWLHGKFYTGRLNFMLLDLDKSSNVDEMGNLNVNNDAIIKFKSKLINPHHKLKVVNECNGLICLKAEAAYSSYIICNLLTGQQVIIEQIHEMSYCSVMHYGLGCCPVSHQFKVLRIIKMRSGKNVANIQTLGSNEWRFIGDAPMSDRFYRSAPFLHGSLHRHSRKGNFIWSFNFETEQFLQLQGPNDMKRDSRRNLGVFDSCLCFSSTSRNLKFEIWLMKEYNVKDSWVKQFVFQNEYCTPCIPLQRMNNGEILASNVNSYDLVACDIQSKRCRKVKVCGVSSFKVMVCDAKFSKLN